MNNLPDGVTQPMIDEASGYETPSQERARELMEQIEEDWNSLWHEIVSAEQSYCEANGGSLPERMAGALKEIRERYT